MVSQMVGRGLGLGTCVLGAAAASASNSVCPDGELLQGCIVGHIQKLPLQMAQCPACADVRKGHLIGRICDIH